MGVNFVIMVENRLQRSQEEVNAVFGVFRSVDITFSEWKCFTYKGKSYASWMFTPRYFEPKVGSPKWEALRKYLVRVKEFFGSEKVF